MSLWRKLLLLGKAFTSRRELEEELSQQLFELQGLESNLRGQLAAIETAKMILENDRLNLTQLKDHMSFMNSEVVVDMRDWHECRLTILELDRAVFEQTKQLNEMEAVTQSVKAKIERGVGDVELIRDTLKNLGKVLPWTKRMS